MFAPSTSNQHPPKPYKAKKLGEGSSVIISLRRANANPKADLRIWTHMEIHTHSISNYLKKSKSFRIRLRIKSELAMGARLARPSRAHVSDRGSGGGPRWWRRLKLDADARGRGKSPLHLPSKYTSQGGGERGEGRIEIE